MSNNQDTLLIYYDAGCNLCTSLVERLKTLSQGPIFNCIPYQIVSTSPLHFNELIVIIGAKEYKAAEAVIAILSQMKGLPRMLARCLQLMPVGILNRCYYVIARNRYRLFGQNRTCTIH